MGSDRANAVDSISHCFREGHKKDAEILLNHGADVELPDNYGQSPLFMACWKGKCCNYETMLNKYVGTGTEMSGQGNM